MQIRADRRDLKGKSNLIDHIYIDKSGDPSSHTTRHLVVAFIHLKDKRTASINMKRTLKRIKRRGLYPSDMNELKFNLLKNMPEVRKIVPKKILKQDVRIGVVVVDKTKHLGWSEKLLYESTVIDGLVRFLTVLSRTGSLGAHLVISLDKRLRKSERDMFNKHALSKIYQLRDSGVLPIDLVEVKHVPSEADPCIWMADYVAGAFFQEYERGRREYSSLIKRSGKLIWMDEGSSRTAVLVGHAPLILSRGATLPPHGADLPLPNIIQPSHTI